MFVYIYLFLVHFILLDFKIRLKVERSESRYLLLPFIYFILYFLFFYELHLETRFFLDFFTFTTVCELKIRAYYFCCFYFINFSSLSKKRFVECFVKSNFVNPIFSFFYFVSPCSCSVD